MKRMRILLFFFFFDLDAQRLEELQILIVNFEFRVGGESGNERGFVGGFFALLANADGGFEYEKNIVAAFFNAGDNFGDLFGVRERFVDGFAEFLHELLELLIHVVPPVRRLAWRNTHLDARRRRTVSADAGLRYCIAED